MIPEQQLVTFMLKTRLSGTQLENCGMYPTDAAPHPFKPFSKVELQNVFI